MLEQIDNRDQKLLGAEEIHRFNRDVEDALSRIQVIHIGGHLSSSIMSVMSQGLGTEPSVYMYSLPTYTACLHVQPVQPINMCNLTLPLS